MQGLFDGTGRPLALGRCLGRGGEGAVYALPGRQHLAAKVRTRRPGAETSRKLRAMIALRTAELSRVAAWPSDVLLDAPEGRVVGFLMPRVDAHRPIHALYGPSTRRREFPEATWALLVRAARNLAAGFATVHSHGHVIGDVNQGNALVSSAGAVRLIDCDSFQVSHEGRTYPCGVGVPLFTPPELHGRLDRVARTPDHDAFGLAVLVFQLLFMGRHPYAGCLPGRNLAVETAIRDGIFAFGAGSAAEGWAPPPFSLRLEDLPPAVAALFERAFRRDAARAPARPRPVEWAETLAALEADLVTCEGKPRHVHARGDGRCPWCRIDEEGGPSFFASPTELHVMHTIDLSTAWAAIEAVPSPGPAGQPPAAAARRLRLAGRPLPPRIHANRRWRYFMAGVSATFAAASVWARQPLGGLGFAGLWALRPRADEIAEREARRLAVEASQVELRRLLAVWEKECGEAGFLHRRRELERVKRTLDSLPQLEEHERRNLGLHVRRVRQKRHLRGQPLSGAVIPGLSATVLRRLSQAGVETAADLDAARLARVDGMAAPLRAALLAWRHDLASAFALDSARDVDQADLRALERRQQRRRDSLARVLRDGAFDLGECRQAVLARREEIGGRIGEAHRRLAQARADLARA